MQVNVIFHPTATQIECHSNACATFANSNQCFFSRIPFFSGHVYVGNWRVWKTIRFFSTKHIGGCGTPGTKKIYRSLRPQPRCSCFSRSGGVTGYKNGMMFWCCSNLAVKLMILTQTYSRFGFAIATYLVFVLNPCRWNQWFGIFAPCRLAVFPNLKQNWQMHLQDFRLCVLMMV